MANGSLEWFPPNRLATTFPEFHNLKGIPEEKSYLFVRQWLNFIWNRPKKRRHTSLSSLVAFFNLGGQDNRNMSNVNFPKLLVSG